MNGFVPVVQDLCDVMGRESPKRPGYQLWSVSDYTKNYKACDHQSGSRIVEVLGPTHFSATRGYQPVVAVLRDEEVDIYQALQWKDWWRWHGDVAIAKGLMFLAAWIVLVIIHAVLAYFVGGDVAFRLVAIPLLPLLEIATGIWLWRKGRCVYGMLRVLYLVHRAKISGSGRNYRELFEALTRANDKDKAAAARTMLRLRLV